MTAQPTEAAAGAGWDAAVGATVNPSDRRGGTLRLVSSADVDSLDPARTYYVWVWLLQRMLNRTLMAYPTEPGPAGLVPVPDLAERPGRVSDGGRTWTYRLRENLRYDDGTPITSDDIRHAVQRVFAQDVLPGGPTYLVPLLDDPARRYPGPYRTTDPLRSVLTPDERTIVFRLRRPFSDFDHLMAQPCAAPVPRRADTGADYGENPRSSGPYRIAAHRPGTFMHFERNPYWDRATDPVRPALPDRVELTIGVDVDELDERLIAGEFDINLEGRGLQHAAQGRVTTDGVLRSYTDNPRTSFLHFVSIQPHIPPFDNVHARRAVHYAADKILLQRARGGPVTGGDLTTALFPPRLPAHQDLDRYPTGPDLRGDLDAARAELAAAGLPDGFDAVIGTQRGKFRLVADAVAESVARVGIRLTVKELDVASYFSLGAGHPETIREHALGLIVTDWGADFPTEYGFLAPLVDGRQIKRNGGNWNISELDDPRVNELIDQSLHTTDPAERARQWGAVERLVMEHAVILPLVHDKTLHFRNPWVTNVYVHPAFGLYDVQAMGLAPDHRDWENTP
ncbi:peptide ABC transporter substrate-binding protein [Streptomyces albiflavescens]|uniref:Peptide ABC transporter substrate-binding protein n=1 Tax=Streptomyces albiflavescens TaxID=1623582 RepID=A0A917Y7S3_9ACTN|nr:ABC transporter substrate-binding protein [Streptomyces albiflavescens]GGN74181.1 peptide ABC transporter substrate-binding protein [Streptomyces albiflavescens]